MSAFLVSQDCINLIVNASATPNANLFALLLDENLRSLATRYPAYIEEYREAAREYAFEKITPRNLVKRVYGERKADNADVVKYYPATGKPVTPARVAAQIIQACSCFEYQACETADYDTTEAANFVRYVRDRYVSTSRLEDEAVWSF